MKHAAFASFGEAFYEDLNITRIMFILNYDDYCHLAAAKNRGCVQKHICKNSKQ